MVITTSGCGLILQRGLIIPRLGDLSRSFSVYYSEKDPIMSRRVRGGGFLKRDFTPRTHNLLQETEKEYRGDLFY
jgi:hypothetical protein